MWRTVAPCKFESSQTPNADAWSFMIDTGKNVMIECRTRQVRWLHTGAETTRVTRPGHECHSMSSIRHVGVSV